MACVTVGEETVAGRSVLMNSTQHSLTDNGKGTIS